MLQILTQVRDTGLNRESGRWPLCRIVAPFPSAPVIAWALPPFQRPSPSSVPMQRRPSHAASRLRTDPQGRCSSAGGCHGTFRTPLMRSKPNSVPSQRQPVRRLSNGVRSDDAFEKAFADRLYSVRGLLDVERLGLARKYIRQHAKRCRSRCRPVSSIRGIISR
jgi:hypothetical protein